MKNAKIVVLIILSANLITLSLFANDGAVEVAAGGVVFKELHGVTMESEVLKISPEKVEVTFRFRNNTDKDIETNVAFPVPPFGYYAESNHHKIPDFHDFTVFVDGRTIKYDTEIKAIANEKECTDLLKKKGVPFKNVGYEGFCLEDYFKSSEVKKYVSLGIVEPYEWGGGNPLQACLENSHYLLLEAEFSGKEGNDNSPHVFTCLWSHSAFCL